MRLFIAIELPSEIKTALGLLQTELRPTQASVSWTKPANMHLTLRFLGKVEPRRLPTLKQLCVEAAQPFASFPLTLNGLGFFPSFRKPKVLWAGLADEAKALTLLHYELEERLAAQGFGREDKPFHPHLTLGRLKAPEGAKTLFEHALAYHLPALQFTATQLVLMQSQLDSTGSIYTPLSCAPFNTAQSLSDRRQSVLE